MRHAIKPVPNPADAARELGEARAELRASIIDVVRDIVRTEDDPARALDEAGRLEDQRSWLSRLVYALDGEVPPWDPAVRVRDLMAAAGDAPPARASQTVTRLRGARTATA